MSNTLFPEATGARFSTCRTYRYALWRVWDDSRPKIMFIGLNPSTASENQDDPTIRRVTRFAKDWGFGGIYMCNLFALVSTDPNALLTHPDPVGPRNDAMLAQGSDLCQHILFAWGQFKQSKDRAAEVIRHFPNALALKVTKDKSPWHPLYVAAATLPVPYSILVNQTVQQPDKVPD